MIPFDPEEVRADFPVLSREVNGRPLTFLDSAASALSPVSVLEAMRDFESTRYANVHRGIYTLSEEATTAFEAARDRVARFIGASSSSEVVFTRNATESLNLVAASFAGARLKEGDAVLVTEAEHHSNLVPWQLLKQRAGIRLVVAPLTEKGDLDMAEYQRLLAAEAPRVVSVPHVSNVLGTVMPLDDISAAARAAGAWVVVDGAQGIVHAPVDLETLDCDFYAFSGHKIYGPTGIGVLWGRSDLLAEMPPLQGGGETIRSAGYQDTTCAAPPARFEAGTPAFVQAVGLATALDYMDDIGRARIRAAEDKVMAHAMNALAEIDGIRFLGTPAEKAGAVAFNLEGAHPADVATLLDQEGVAVRAGHHCAQPLHERFGLTASARASFGLYTTCGDVDRFVAALLKAKRMLVR